MFVEYFHCSPFNAQLSFSAKVPELSPLKSSSSFATDALLYVLDGHSNRLSDIKAINLKYDYSIINIIITIVIMVFILYIHILV